MPTTPHRLAYLAHHAHHPLILRAETVNESARTVEAVIATEARVLVFDLRRGEPIEEILLMSGAEIPRQIPLLENHRRDSLEHHLGSIRNIRIARNIELADGTRADRALIGVLHFAETAEAEQAWDLVRAGHVTDVSTGNQAIEAELLEAGETATINGRQYTAGNRPLQITTKWRPREGSMVSIGADPAATTRSATMPPTYARRRLANESEKRAIVAGLLTRAGVDSSTADPDRSISAQERERGEWFDSIVTAARRCLELERVEVPAAHAQIIDRALMTASFGDVLTDVAERILLTVLAEEADTVSPWTRDVDLPNYRAHSLAHILGGQRLEKRERGTPAQTLAFGAQIESEAIQLHQYGGTFSADRQDLATDDIGIVREAIADMVRAAVRTRHDLAYFPLLNNPTMRDGNNLFDSSNHGNVVGGGLNDTNLATALKLIRSQRINGQTAALSPAALLVPPALEQAGRAAIRAIHIEGESAPLQLVVEDRLANGITDPVSGTVAAGSDTTWFVSTAGHRGMVFGWLEGSGRRPDLNSFPFQGEGGFWGQRWAVKADMAAAPSDWRGLVRGNT